MTEENKKKAMEAIDGLTLKGGTDIHGAISKGIEQVVQRKDKTRNP